MFYYSWSNIVLEFDKGKIRRYIDKMNNFAYYLIAQHATLLKSRL